MSDTLATLKEENHLSDVTHISQIFAPRYMTRSRVIPESHEVVAKMSEDLKHEDGHSHDSLATAPSEFEDDVEPPVVTTPSPPAKRSLPVGFQQDEPAVRKRGRHKEYTAPTGVWRTNGGYISTIYVGNKRIYGPLRDNPVDAGYDRQQLIDAKAFVRTEVEMRRFILSLKTTTPFVKSDTLPINDKHRPQLTTIQSGITTIVPPH